MPMSHYHSPVTGWTSGRIAVAFCCLMASGAATPLPLPPALVPGSSPKLELPMDSPLWLVASRGLAWLDTSSSEREDVIMAAVDAWWGWGSSDLGWEKEELAGPVEDREEKLWPLVLYVCIYVHVCREVNNSQGWPSSTSGGKSDMFPCNSNNIFRNSSEWKIPCAPYPTQTGVHECVHRVLVAMPTGNHTQCKIDVWDFTEP